MAPNDKNYKCSRCGAFIPRFLIYEAQKRNEELGLSNHNFISVDCPICGAKLTSSSDTLPKYDKHWKLRPFLASIVLMVFCFIASLIVSGFICVILGLPTDTNSTLKVALIVDVLFGILVFFVTYKYNADEFNY